jgi:vacuolar-type H+-ATPase subunit H
MNQSLKFNKNESELPEFADEQIAAAISVHNDQPMSTDAIQSLLEAEHQAQSIVQNARAERDRILRAAEEDARSEIRATEAQAQSKLGDLKDRIQREVDDATRQMEDQTERDLAAFRSDLSTKLKDVANLLTEAVLRVEIP